MLSVANYCCCLVIKLCLTFAAPCSVACLASLSLGFPVKNTGVGFHFPLQATFLTQELNLHFLHWQVILYHQATREAPDYLLEKSSQNYNEVSPHSSQKGHHQEVYK